MSIKILTPVNDNVGVTVNIHTANLEKGTMVKITGDDLVDACAAAAEDAIGYVFKAARVADGPGTIQTRFGYLVEAPCDGAIAAAAHVQIGDNNAGVQRFKTYAGADPKVDKGVCLIGAGNNAIGTFLIY